MFETRSTHNRDNRALKPILHSPCSWFQGDVTTGRELERERKGRKRRREWSGGKGIRENKGRVGCLKSQFSVGAGDAVIAMSVTMSLTMLRPRELSEHR